MEKVVSIGYTKKPHALKGEIKLQVEERYIEDLLNAELLMIDIKGKKTPFFIEDVRIGNNIIAKFEDVNTPEAALSIAVKEIFLREEDILPDDEREIEIFTEPYAHCLDFKIFNQGKEIGVVLELIEYPQQQMALIKYQNRDVLVPLNEHFIKKLDNKKKEIIMDLPDGILDL